MKKYGYVIEEKLRFHKEIVLETSLNEDDLINEMERAERKGESAEEVAMLLDNIPGIEVLEIPDMDYSSPYDVEIDYYDHRELKEENK